MSLRRIGSLTKLATTWGYITRRRARSNLMNGSTRTTEQLTPEQIGAIYQWNFRNDGVAFIPQGGTGFLRLIPSPVAGDYNRNGTVDAADYTVWRDTLGTIGYMAADGNKNNAIDAGDLTIWQSNLDKVVSPQSLPGDFNHDGRVDGADYTVWRDTLGKTVAAGTGADANLNGLIDSGDYGIWKTNFSMASSVVVGAAAADVPEPATIVYAVIAAMLVVPFRAGGATSGTTQHVGRRAAVPAVLRGRSTGAARWRRGARRTRSRA